MDSMLVFGATSAMAKAVLRLAAADGVDLILVARNEDKLKALENDLKLRGNGRVESLRADLSKASDRKAALAKVSELGLPSTVFVAHGVLPDEEACASSAKKFRDNIEVNFMSVVELLTPIANEMEQRGSGTVAVISSVAGDRGRKSNYAYGSAKAALATYLSGLRGRLAESSVQVIDFRPGFVDTPMTADIEKGPLFASAEKVGSTMYSAMRSGADVVYVPWFWWPIMTVIKAIPEFIFKRLNL